MTEAKTLSKTFRNAVLYFLLSCSLAIILQWDIADIAWSVWLSSFFIMLLAVIVQNVFFYWLIEIDPPTEEQKASPHYKEVTTESNVSGTLFLTIVGLVIVFGVHLVLVMTLNELFELFDKETAFAGGSFRFSLFVTFAFKHYWIFLCITLIPVFQDYYSIYQNKKYRDSKTQEDLILSPYFNAGKIQLLALFIMILGFLGNGFITYWALLIVYFFPWSETYQYYQSIRNNAKK